MMQSHNCPHLETSPKVISIDPDGDLHLVVGENRCILPCLPSEDTSRSASSRNSDAELTTKEDEEQEQPHEHERAATYIVCSKTLSRTTKIWKRLLYGGFAESKKPDGDEPWIVALPEDSAAPMKIILDIIHGRFGQVPVKGDISLDEFHALTVLTDKYDLTHLLRLWAYDWMEEKLFLFQDGAQGGAPYMENFLRGLWISREIGDKGTFDYILLCAAYRLYSTEGGQLGYRARQSDALQPLFEDILEPPGMTGKKTARWICMLLVR